MTVADSSLLDLLALDKHLPLANVFANAAPRALAEYLMQSWQRAECAMQESNGFQALCLSQDLPWDSELLALNARRIHYANTLSGETGSSAIVNRERASLLQGILGDCLTAWASDGVRLVDARVSNQDLFMARAFERVGFHSVDTLVTLGANRQTLERIAAKTEAPDSELIIRDMHPQDEVALEEISAESFGDYSAIQDRFFLEPSIDHARSQHLFRQWFLNLSKCTRAGSGQILVAEMKGQPVGYIALEPMAPFNGSVWWRDSLNAVSAAARGQGVYRALTMAAFDQVLRMDGAGIITKTQVSTYRVINTWLHLGANIFESSTTFHWTA